MLADFSFFSNSITNSKLNQILWKDNSNKFCSSFLLASLLLKFNMELFLFKLWYNLKIFGQNSKNFIKLKQYD